MKRYAYKMYDSQSNIYVCVCMYVYTYIHAQPHIYIHIWHVDIHLYIQDVTANSSFTYE